MEDGNVQVWLSDPLFVRRFFSTGSNPSNPRSARIRPNLKKIASSIDNFSASKDRLRKWTAILLEISQQTTTRLSGAGVGILRLRRRHEWTCRRRRTRYSLSRMLPALFRVLCRPQMLKSIISKCAQPTSAAFVAEGEAPSKNDSPRIASSSQDLQEETHGEGCGTWLRPEQSCCFSALPPRRSASR